MNSRSRKPCVATKATDAPLRSSTALVATVEPWPRSSIRAMSMPDAVSAANAPISGDFGVLGTLVTTTRPPSTATRSVKVPPTSTPTRIQPLFPARARHIVIPSGARDLCSWPSGSLAALGMTRYSCRRQDLRSRVEQAGLQVGDLLLQFLVLLARL